MDFLDRVSEQLSRLVAERLGEDSQQRLSALYAAHSAMPGADVYDRIRLSRYILTGSEVEPEITTIQTADGRVVAQLREDWQEQYPYPHGEVIVIGPGIFSSTEQPNEQTVINWRGVNFVPQPLGEPIEAGPMSGETPDLTSDAAPMAGSHWSGRRGARRG